MPRPESSGAQAQIVLCKPRWLLGICLLSCLGAGVGLWFPFAVGLLSGFIYRRSTFSGSCPVASLPLWCMGVATSYLWVCALVLFYAVRVFCLSHAFFSTPPRVRQHLWISPCLSVHELVKRTSGRLLTSCRLILIALAFPRMCF